MLYLSKELGTDLDGINKSELLSCQVDRLASISLKSRCYSPVYIGYDYELHFS